MRCRSRSRRSRRRTGTMKSRCRRYPRESCRSRVLRRSRGGAGAPNAKLRRRERGVEIEPRPSDEPASDCPRCRGPWSRRHSFGIAIRSQGAQDERSGAPRAPETPCGWRCRYRPPDAAGTPEVSRISRTHSQDVGHNGLGVLFDPTGFRVADRDGPAGLRPPRDPVRSSRRALVLDVPWSTPIT